MELGGQEEEIGMPISVNYGPIHESSKLKILTSSAGGNGTASSEERQQQQQQQAKKTVRYRECLKNHAASIGGHAIDGCGEFMPSGEDGTLEALKCAACGCHRNFHRREVDGEPPCYYCYNARKDINRKRPPGSPLPLALPSSSPGVIPRPSQMIMAFGSGPNDNDQEHADMMGMHGFQAAHMAMPIMKKRFRTKFTQEQKDKMCSFAEKLGWRIQKHDEAAVQQFCMELGIKRHVLKVWMHNNKHTLGKKL
uniref:TSA: Wollemia nobilis Ref_Wollemi_Transcript_10957_1860 transcribed RNA sequence n=1 Tax=Wollemia nobilis TaxID=56998 RepID=A0A0C9RMF5_9CONI